MASRTLIPENPVTWLRVAYWTGAIIDAKAFFLFLFPGFLPIITQSVFNLDAPNESNLELVLLRRLLALFDLGWTLLLIWADRKPLERKGIMLLTVFPIITGILILRTLTGIQTTVSVYYSITSGVFGLLFLFFGYSYLINCGWFQRMIDKR
ncbi:MAG: hypothetical protein KBA26_05825 [Candidatus Delongbacteria bacterium]|nr:hypothetical protein [Candidatus Delongbacteria bacterium]